MGADQSRTEVERRDAFVERIAAAASGTFELAAMVLGLRLGLYEALWTDGPATSVELAGRTGTSERVIREWLEHGAVTGLLDLVSDSDDPTARVFALPAAHAEVLLDRDSLFYAAATPIQVLAAIDSLPMVQESFRTGAGFLYGDVADDMRLGEGEANRPAYLGPLAQEWIPSIQPIHARLQAHPPARVADIGCGLGWSSIGMAIAYPSITVDGLDLDAPSIEMARRNAADMGVGDRVRFFVADAAAPSLEGRYDVVTVLEAFHDMAHPVPVLGELRRLLAEDGSILIVDMKASERFQVPAEDLERRLYGWSLMQCLHSGLLEGGRGTGTVMRPPTLHAYALEAGLPRFEILPIEHDAWRFYRLRPAEQS